MNHPLCEVTDFEISGPYTLRVTFDDGTTQTINFKPVLRGELFRPLQDLDLFNQVRLDEEIHTLVWPNDADFDPWTLHEWDKLADKLAKQARAWDFVAESI